MIEEYAGSTGVGVAVRDSSGCQVAGLDVAMPVFSVTKLFVATAVLRLVERGELDLDADGPIAGITVRELLGHTSGLPDYVRDPAYGAVEAGGRPWELADIQRVALVNEHGPKGTYRYSNLGYWLLGSLLDPLETTLEREVFTPAGLESTSYPAVGERVTDTGYDTRWAGPAGAAWSTPADLTLFLHRVFDQTLLSAESLAAFTTPITPPGEYGHPWIEPTHGLGTMLDTGLGIAGHSGSGPGYQSAAYFAVEQGRSAAVIVRRESGVDPVEVLLRLLDLR